MILSWVCWGRHRPLERRSVLQCESALWLRSTQWGYISLFTIRISPLFISRWRRPLPRRQRTPSPCAPKYQQIKCWRIVLGILPQRPIIDCNRCPRIWPRETLDAAIGSTDCKSYLYLTFMRLFWTLWRGWLRWPPRERLDFVMIQVLWTRTCDRCMHRDLFCFCRCLPGRHHGGGRRSPPSGFSLQDAPCHRRSRQQFVQDMLRWFWGALRVHQVWSHCRGVW